MEKIIDDGPYFNGEELKDYILAIEDKRKERKIINEQIKEIFDEAGSTGFDKKIMRKLITMREKDFAQMIHEEEMVETYKKALGMNTYG